MTRMISYEAKDTFIHRLSGFSKLVFFILWCTASAITYDTRILLAMVIAGGVIFALSKTRWNQVKTVFKAVMFFMILNLLCIYLFAPDQGTKIYGTRTLLTHTGNHYDLTAEQLFYEFNVCIKYFTVIPSIFIFLVTTNPSELAASMNGVGIPYTVAYSVSIALRYIPDVQGDYQRIKNAQQARGIEMSKKASLPDRIKRTASIIFPLLFSTMDRIDVVSNAMELRGFGKKKKRSWYMKRPLKAGDYIVIIISAALVLFTILMNIRNGGRFYNPFH